MFVIARKYFVFEGEKNNNSNPHTCTGSFCEPLPKISRHTAHNDTFILKIVCFCLKKSISYVLNIFNKKNH